MNIAELQRIRDQLRDNVEAAELVALIETEIKRRQRSGRRSTSPYSRREQNRQAQARWRAKQKTLKDKHK